MALAALTLRLGAAASVSSLAAGMLLVVILLFGPFLDAQPGRGPAEPQPLDLLIWALRFGLEGAFILSALPALAAGAGMWALGRRYAAIRRPLAWAAAGAWAGALFFALAQAVVGLDPFDAEMSDLEAALCAAFLIAGAAAALAFRAVMWLTGPFPGEPPSAGPS